MPTMKGRFTRIKGDYSERRRLPRLGKIRLGLKMKNQNGKEYPTETEYFVCPPEVQAVYGEAPIELDVILPSNDVGVVFPQKLAMYGQNAGLKCHGDGEKAHRYNEQTHQWEERTCPCEHLKTAENPNGRCMPKSDLMVMLPLVSMGGVYQIKTGSHAATAGINTSLEMIQEMAGRISFVPMKLRRIPEDMTHDGKKRTHYIMTLTLNATWQQAAALRKNPDAMLLPAQYEIDEPIDDNPECDQPDQVVVDAEDLADMEEGQLAQVQQKLLEQKRGATPAHAAVAPAQGNGSAPVKRPGITPKNGGDAPVPKSTSLKQILDYIDNDSRLTDIKDEWKNLHKVTNITKLKEAGIASLLDHLRANAINFPY